MRVMLEIDSVSIIFRYFESSEVFSVLIEYLLIVWGKQIIKKKRNKTKKKKKKIRNIIFSQVFESFTKYEF